MPLTRNVQLRGGLLAGLVAAGAVVGLPFLRRGGRQLGIASRQSIPSGRTDQPPLPLGGPERDAATRRVTAGGCPRPTPYRGTDRPARPDRSPTTRYTLGHGRAADLCPRVHA